ncbi:MAG: hypothetical protein R3D63_01995 [Paracoccaceae bacterium]
MAIPSAAALAQDLSDDEIIKRFEVQRDAYNDLRAGKGLTRGLTIVSVDDLGDDSGASGASGVSVADTSPDLAPAPGGDTAADSVDVTVAGDTTPQPEDTTVALAEVKADAPPAAMDAGTVGVLPDELQVNVRISFDYDSATIKADQQPVLDQMCRVMKGSDIKLFRIMGHTDSPGPTPITRTCRCCAPKRSSAVWSRIAASRPTGSRRWAWANASWPTPPTPRGRKTAASNSRR